MTVPSNSEEPIFNRAVELPAAERNSYLDQACGGDGALRRRVEALLRAHDSAGNLLDAAPGGAIRAALSKPPPQEMTGTLIGRYKLLQKIGEGGFGIVYMAEQEEPVRRRVALKIIKLGMDTKAVIARFEAERQALALMDHPNIARVLDAGATDTGRPYFVMDLVRGVPVTKYCDEHNLPTSARLELFTQVCQAVQHAHQKGIIHRDLKPSNILVTLNDGVPMPKVIDFGIAKATQGRLTERTLFTAFEQFIGTPAYMSPEQAEMSSVDVDTRSDIYALGVLLYELLTGQTPFDAKTLGQAGLDEIRRVIREVEPPRPSARLSTLADTDRTSAAKRRGTDAGKLSLLLRGDLDWIVMKCLEKDRQRRYETANSLAMDLQRYMRHEPVLARPPSTAYLARKLVRRHRFAFGASAAIAASLVVGLGISTWEFFKERDARKRAVTAEQAQIMLREQAETGEQKAQTEAARRAQVAGFLQEIFKDIGLLAAVEGDTRLLSRILDQAVARLEKELLDQPRVKADLLETLGGISFNIGEFSRAEAVFTEALALRRQERAPLEVARSLNYLGLVLSAENKLADSEDRLREALKINLSVLDPGHPEVARTLSNLGWGLGQQGRVAEGKALLNDALDLQRKLPGGENTDMAQSLKRLGVVFLQEGRLADSETNLREALRISISRLGHDNLEVASSLYFLAVTLAIQDQDPDFQKLELGKIEEAIKHYREATGIREKLRKFGGVQSPDSLITVLTQQGTLAEVDAAVREAHRYARTLYPNDQWKEAYYYALSTFLLLEEHQWTDGEAAARQCLKLRDALRPDDWSTYNARSLLGAALLGQGKLTEAEPFLREGYEGMKQRAASIPKDHRIWLGESLQLLVRLYTAWSKPGEAGKWRREFDELVKTAGGRPPAPALIGSGGGR
jgi:serine/threonine protein kinase